MKERTILHSDVNNFFASVESATRPELKDKPVAVTGNPKKRTGIILAKNEIAMASKQVKPFGKPKISALTLSVCHRTMTFMKRFPIVFTISIFLTQISLNHLGLTNAGWM